MPALDDLVWRAPTPDDAEAIGRMHHQAWVDAYSGLLPDDVVEPARDRELWGLYVAREHHGSGLARALAEQALGDGPAELWLFDGNPRAEAFYRKLGFERDGVEAPHRETGLHGIRMVRGG